MILFLRSITMPSLTYSILMQSFLLTKGINFFPNVIKTRASWIIYLCNVNHLFTIRLLFNKNTKSIASKSSLTPTEIELIDRVHAHFQRNDPNKFHFFYTTASPFSNFHPCTITEDGYTFHSNEQYMMYHKASK